jgi:DNA-binding CsgD family transcriptional regulator
MRALSDEVRPGMVMLDIRMSHRRPRSYAKAAPRAVEIAAQGAEGLRCKELADRFGRSEDTVTMHMKNVVGTLGVNTRAEAIEEAGIRGSVR